ncbi:hypothetical protein BC829DRAFT_449176 [Chytridium lagenaria]|nr:hypothetical protein BC829DRAFT_449176 [Chytridium lagenaria]
MQNDVDDNAGNNGIDGLTVASTLAAIPLTDNHGRNSFVIPTPASTPPPMAAVDTRLHCITFECTVRCYSSQKLAKGDNEFAPKRLGNVVIECNELPTKNADGTLVPLLHNNWTTNSHEPGKEVGLTIFKFGNVFKTAPDFAAYRQNITAERRRNQDRSGAASERVLADTVEELKRRHQGHYASQDINWRLWAAQICSLGEGQRLAALDEPPPFTLIGHFKSLNPNRHMEARQLQRSLDVARQVIQSVEYHLPPVLMSIKEAGKMMEDALRRIEGFQHAIDAQKRIIEAVGHALPPTENNADFILLQGMQDQMDVDHM